MEAKESPAGVRRESFDLITHTQRLWAEDKTDTAVIYARTMNPAQLVRFCRWVAQTHGECDLANLAALLDK